MSALIVVPSSAGDILIEADRTAMPAAVTRGGAGGAIETAASSFEDGWAKLTPVARHIIEQLSAAADGLQEIKVTFGVKFSAAAGAFIASASSEANFTVDILWRKPPPAA